MFYLAKQEIIEIIGTYEWNQATSTFDVFDFFFFFEQSHHNAKACGTPANKWYLVKNYLLEKSFCWCAESAACIFILGSTTFPDIPRSRHLEAFFKTAVLKHLTKFSGNYEC